MRRQKRTAGAAYTVHVPVKEEAIGMYKKAMLVGAAGGLVLYLLTAAEDIVYCAYVSSVIDSALLYVYFPLGVLTAVITILYRNKTPKRLLSASLSCWPHTQYTSSRAAGSGSYRL